MNEVKVILIEDHDLTRIGMRTALQRRDGIHVIGEAYNATQGLQILQVSKPDVAIVDIGLPDMDGIELIRRFRASQMQDENLKTKILILTLNNSEDAVLAAFAAGADSYCMKDVSTDQLVEAIQATYQGENWIDPSIANVVLQQARKAQSDMSAAKSTVSINAIDPEYGQLLEQTPLTERELEVLELIVAGCSNESISQKLHLTVGTVKTHVRNILNKMCVNDRTQAAVRALRAGLIA
jgi:DNA-binding NarL/FixJ family response regulator